MFLVTATISLCGSSNNEVRSKHNFFEKLLGDNIFLYPDLSRWINGFKKRWTLLQYDPSNESQIVVSTWKIIENFHEDKIDYRRPFGSHLCPNIPVITRHHSLFCSRLFPNGKDLCQKEKLIIWSQLKNIISPFNPTPSNFCTSKTDADTWSK